MRKLVMAFVVAGAFCMCSTPAPSKLDVNEALDYCALQTKRTLEHLKTDAGIDYTMMPRNILRGEQNWNVRR